MELMKSVIPVFALTIFSLVIANEDCLISPLMVSNGKTHETLLTNKNCGIALNVSSLRYPPEVRFLGVSKFDNYTLMILSRNRTHLHKQYYLNWLLVNIHPNGTLLTVHNSTTLAGYQPPREPLTGKFNYTIKVWRQKASVPLKTIHDIERNYFSPEKWIQEEGTTRFAGPPIASTAFVIAPPKIPISPNPIHPNPAQHPIHPSHPNSGVIHQDDHGKKNSKNSAPKDILSGSLILLISSFYFILL